MVKNCGVRYIWTYIVQYGSSAPQCNSLPAPNNHNHWTDDKLVIFFLVTTRKKVFDISCKLSPQETICMHVYFLGKMRKMSSAEFLPSIWALNCCAIWKRALISDIWIASFKTQFSPHFLTDWLGSFVFISIVYSIQRFCKRVTKAQIRLRICAVWSGPLLPAFGIKPFSCVKNLRVLNRWQWRFWNITWTATKKMWSNLQKILIYQNKRSQIIFIISISAVMIGIANFHSCLFYWSRIVLAPKCSKWKSYVDLLSQLERTIVPLNTTTGNMASM